MKENKRKYRVKVTYVVCDYYEVEAHDEVSACEIAEETSQEHSLNDYQQIDCQVSVIKEVTNH